MNTLQKTGSIALIAVFALFVAFTVNPHSVLADGEDCYDCGGYDSTYSGYDSTYGGYDSTYSGYDSTYGGYDSTYGGYDSTYGGYDSTYGGYDSTYGGYDSTYGGYDSTYGGYDSTYGGYDSTYGGYDSTYGGYDSTYGGYDSTYDPYYADTSWTDSCYDYDGCSYGGTDYYNSYGDGVLYSNSSGGGGYSSGGSYSSGGGVARAPSISSVGTSRSTGGSSYQPITVTAPQYRSSPTYVYSNPTYTQPSQPHYTTPTQQIQYTSSGQPIYINNVNTNTNTNVNTAPVTPVYQTPISYPTVYVQPAPSCSIYVNNYGYNNQATLTWSATNGTSAYISPSLGNVGPSGSLTVYPSNGQIYTMTITGPGGTNTCSTQAFYYNYQPAPTPVQNISCNLTASQSSISNGASTVLSWNSYGATSARLNDGLGNVAPNGSLTVMPEANRNYVLTVYGANGQTASCYTNVNVSGAFVSLTQIPYTGFDFGATGNAIYWAGLIAFAMAGAYLVIYYRGGAAIFASQMMGATRQASVPQPQVAFAAPVARASYAPAAPIKREASARTERVAPIAPAAPKVMNDYTATTDSLLIQQKAGEMPRIVIARA